MKVSLKLLKTSDISKNYIEWLNNREVTKYTDQSFYKHTYKSISNYVSKITISKNDYLYGIYILDKKKSYHVGNIKIGNINKIHKNAVISYLIGEQKYWGKGIATKAVKQIIQVAKKRKLRKLIAGSNTKNIASIKVLKNCGFKKEGLQTSYGKYKNTRFDNYIFGLSI